MAIYNGMLGIAELMANDAFLAWVETQEDDLLDSTETRDVWNMFQTSQENRK